MDKIIAHHLSKIAQDKTAFNNALLIDDPKDPDSINDWAEIARLSGYLADSYRDIADSALDICREREDLLEL